MIPAVQFLKINFAWFSLSSNSFSSTQLMGQMITELLYGIAQWSEFYAYI